MERIAAEPTYPQARAAGVVYLSYFLAAFLGAYLMKGLIVSGDSAATASNILAHETLYRSGFAVDLVANALYIGLTALFYRLFEPVNRGLSLLAAFFSLVGCAVQIFGDIFQLAPLVILADNSLLGAFKVEQLQSAALLCVKLHAQSVSIALVFFAFYDLFIGYLIYRSTFLPRILGVVLMVAGLGWLTFLWPPLATSLSAFVLPLGALAELLLMLWLLIKGVNASTWREAAGAGRIGGT